MLDDFNDAEIAELALYVSPGRLAQFHAIAGGERDAVLLHQHVMMVGSALASILALIEIALRNAICERLSNMFGTVDWLRNPPAGFSWRPAEVDLINAAERHAQRAQYAKLLEADKRALDALAYPMGVPATVSHDKRVKKRQKAIVVNSDQVVAQLTLFFWKRLFSDDYEASLWKRSLRQAFPNKRLTRSDVADPLELIYQTRNRVAHHEPVYGPRLTEVLPAIDFVCQNFRSRRPSDATPLGKLLRPYRDRLAERVQALDDTMAMFRPVPAEPETEAGAALAVHDA
jgi:hypothetical protein